MTKHKQELIQQKKDISKSLITWYQEHKRDLPWRKTKNPYHILVSEIMLQQTQVKTVLPYYDRFLKTLPTLKDLALASENTLYQLWQGLGYYSRAERLQAFAQAVLKNHQGKIPSNKEALFALPGIGPYTGGAVLSFAFKKQIPAVDGNVKRVIARLLSDNSDIMKAKTTKAFTEFVEAILPKDTYSFNQGLIELGALICKPKNPDCINCPFLDYCFAYKENTVQLLPNKPKKKKAIEKQVLVFILEENGNIFCVKRPKTGLLKNQWGFLTQEYPQKTKNKLLEGDINKETLASTLTSVLNSMLTSTLSETLSPVQTSINLTKNHIESFAFAQIKHVFSHRIWHEKIYYVRVQGFKEQMEESPHHQWNKAQNIPLPSAFKKALDAFLYVKQA